MSGTVQWSLIGRSTVPHSTVLSNCVMCRVIILPLLVTIWSGSATVALYNFSLVSFLSINVMLL